MVWGRRYKYIHKKYTSVHMYNTYKRKTLILTLFFFYIFLEIQFVTGCLKAIIKCLLKRGITPPVLKPDMALRKPHNVS
jgi:hypothetical protein